MCEVALEGDTNNLALHVQEPLTGFWRWEARAVPSGQTCGEKLDKRDARRKGTVGGTREDARSVGVLMAKDLAPNAGEALLEVLLPGDNLYVATIIPYTDDKLATLLQELTHPFTARPVREGGPRGRFREVGRSVKSGGSGRGGGEGLHSRGHRVGKRGQEVGSGSARSRRIPTSFLAGREGLRLLGTHPSGEDSRE
eukprot:scaffold28352_cov34-Tisochrysis_lutea.AAC.1